MASTHVTSLTDQLRSTSVRKHSMSDSIVNARLLTVLVDRVLYARALSCFYWILSRIEHELIQASTADKRLVPFLEASKPLFRRDAIAQDLEYYLGPDWEIDATKHSLQYVQPYLDRLKYISKHKSILLAAHAFTQHQAFASGGRILASKVIPKGLGLDPKTADGRRAFEYDGDDAYVRAQRDAVKSALDDMGCDVMTAEERELFVQEHCLVFTMNNDIVTSFRVGWVNPFWAGLSFMSRTVLSSRTGWMAVSLLVLWMAYVYSSSPSSNRESQR